MTIFWGSNPNRTSIKIILTLSVDGYTTMLQVQTPSKLLKSGFNSHLFWEVQKAQMVVFGLFKGLASRESVVNWCIVLYGWSNFFSGFVVY